MPTITLSIPEDLKREMDEERDINWSEVARAAIRKRLEELKLFRSIVAKSKLTEQDALELGRMVKMSVHERHEEEYSKKKR